MELTINTEYLLATAVAVITIIGAKVAFVRFVYNKGKKAGVDETCAQRIEKKLDGLKDKFDEEIKSTDVSHRMIHERIDTTNKEVNNIKSNVSYIKGRIDEALGTKAN